MLDPTHTGDLKSWGENDNNQQQRAVFFFCRLKMKRNQWWRNGRLQRGSAVSSSARLRRSPPAGSWYLLWKHRDTARLRSARRRPFQHHTHKWGMLMRRRMETKRPEQHPLGDNEFTPHFSYWRIDTSGPDVSAMGLCISSCWKRCRVINCQFIFFIFAIRYKHRIF